MIYTGVKNKQVVLIKKAFDVKSDWNNIIDLLDSKYNNTEYVDQNKSEYRYKNIKEEATDILKYNHFFCHVWHIDNPKEDNLSKFLGIKEFMNNVVKKLDSKGFSLKASISLVSNGNVIPEHSDTHHSLFLGIIGKSKIKIDYKGKDSEYYILERGDVMLIPEDITHSVESPTPRASFIFDINTGKNE